MTQQAFQSRKLDSFDRRILANLQRDGLLGPGEMAELIHLSMSQCSRRIQRLRSEGYVEKTVALLSDTHLEIGVVAYIRTTLQSHAAAHIKAFQERIRSVSQITECHKLIGQADYLLKVCTKDLRTYNVLLTETLLAAPEIAQIQSSIILESLKATTELPLEFL